MKLKDMLNYFIYLFSALTLISCGNLSGSISNSSNNASPGSSTLTLSNVQALFPTNGSNWMDYVDNDRTKQIDALTDTACTTQNTYYDCIHGGELRKVTVNGASSCTGLVMTDQLGVFNWLCSESESPVFFYSSGLKDGKGLKDLIDATAFKNNKVILTKDSTQVAETTSANNWWSNSFSQVTLNSGGADPVLSLNSSGTIYTVNASGVSRGIHFDASKTALVVLPSQNVTAHTTMANDCDNSLTAAGNQPCLIQIGNNSDQVWIEGDFIASTGLNDGYILTNGDFSAAGAATRGLQLRNSNFTVPTNTLGGVSINDAYGAIIKDTNVIGNYSQPSAIFFYTTQGALIANTNVANTQRGIDSGSGVGGINGVTLKNVTATNHSDKGIRIKGGNWTLQDVRVSNSNHGLYSSGGSIKLSRVQATNNAIAGLRVSPINNKIQSLGITLANTNIDGLFLEGPGADSNFTDTLSINNSTGLRIDASNYTFYNTLPTNNDLGFLFRNGSTDNKFSEKLVIGNGTNCVFILAGANPGLSGANCANQGTSDATLTTGISATNYFGGNISAETTNTHSSGLQAFASITDWFNFDNFFRTWGNNGTFLDSGTRNRCTAGSCRIIDWSLSASATEALNANGVFTNGAACPASVQGDVTEDASGSGEHYLLHASEVLFDRIGDDDGLCESNETCIYHPNIGAYQGTGDFTTQSCTFSDGSGGGAVTGVTMYAYPNN